MAWALLGIAGILEIAFAYWMKSSEGFSRLMPALLTVVTGLSSVFLLSLSLRTLPVGLAMRYGPVSAQPAPRFWEWRCWAIPWRR